MKIGDFEKLKKADMVEEYKKLLQSFVDLEGSIGDKDELNEVKKNYEILNGEHNKLKAFNKSIVSDKDKEITRWVDKCNQLETELEDTKIVKDIVKTEVKVEDGRYGGVPINQLPEEKLVEVIKGFTSTINKQAKKIKKLKK